MKVQSKLEERLNAFSHGIGAFLGVIGIILLLLQNSYKSEFSIVSIVVYGLSIIILFTSSTVYHSVSTPDLKHKFRILDHISIYILIAGTYTPIVLISLLQSKGLMLLGLVWVIALFGVILKLFFTGKFNAISTVLYVAMGWLIVLDFEALKTIVEPNGIYLLFTGGFFYTVGVIFYAVEKIPYNHVIWHFFVLAGAISHFLMILNYVI
ncbi:hemolysin III family protein [Aurantibacter sp.]|uniref:PAQR family membrane homeostasis protein TrhA n=1 Tax=Aurantibacter sp. TaxID=2807103 RepID=UPI0035C78E12